MSAKPTVCCVMLVNGREAMTRRAIASFRAQTYEHKRLLIVDSGERPLPLDAWGRHDGVIFYREPDLRGCTVGALRNWVNQTAKNLISPDLIAHWDSDDWSHSCRLEEQVALLEASGKMCVGYRELLFWDTRPKPNYGECFPAESEKAWREIVEGCAPPSNEAWLYRNDDPRYATGASYLYRRELWECQPFPDEPHEDYTWWRTPLVSRNCMGVSALARYVSWSEKSARMICQIHGANTEAYDRAKMLAGAQVWRRAPEYDQLCAERML